MWAGIALGTLGSAAPPALAQTARADSTGTLVGVVTMRDGGLPLAYSIVSLPGLGRERFSNDAGVFVFTNLPAGPVQVHVRHLGYSPADVAVTVHSARVDTVRIVLSHIAVRLTAMQVRAFAECKSPGAPDPARDSAFATIFDQLRLNAEQYSLLARAYPFMYSIERTQWHSLVDKSSRTDRIDTVRYDSRTAWKYEPGRMLVRDDPTRGAMTLHLPTLVDFADKDFLENHCFYDAGVETVDGQDLLRIDFAAASRISDPDVDGSMYLAPQNFQIRRTVIRLSKVPRSITGLRSTEATTIFADLFPFIPVISGVSAISQLDARRASATATTNEEQRLLRVDFLDRMPGQDARKP